MFNKLEILEDLNRNGYLTEDGRRIFMTKEKYERDKASLRPRRGSKRYSWHALDEDPIVILSSY